MSGTTVRRWTLDCYGLFYGVRCNFSEDGRWFLYVGIRPHSHGTGHFEGPSVTWLQR